MIRALGCLLISGVLLSSCSLAGDAIASRFSLGLEPNSIVIAPGESGEVEVTIKPLTGVELKPGAASVSLYRPPAGISAEKITIPSSLDGVLTIEVAEDVALTLEDEPLELEIRADKGGDGGRGTLELAIAPTDESDED